MSRSDNAIGIGAAICPGLEVRLEEVFTCYDCESHRVHEAASCPPAQRAENDEDPLNQRREHPRMSPRFAGNSASSAKKTNARLFETASISDPLMAQRIDLRDFSGEGCPPAALIG